VQLRADSDSAEEAALQLPSCDALVVAFPLYVDSIPSHLVGFLEKTEHALRRMVANSGDHGSIALQKKDASRGSDAEDAARIPDAEKAKRISDAEDVKQVSHLKGTVLYVAVNCGFMEPEHTEVVADMMRLWCETCGLSFGRMAAFGGGGMGPSLPIGRGPGKDYGVALDALASDIKEKGTGEPILTRVNIPRCFYIKVAHSGWRKAVRKRGLKARDLYRRPEPQTE
jgi:hypothetical protein